MNVNNPTTFQGRRTTLRHSALLLALVSGGVGCFRATGLNRPTSLASEIPAIGGDRVKGNKAESGPGDYFIGNDFMELAVDGALFGTRRPLAGAASGGSIVDMSYASLDTSFHRVSMPGDLLERLTPVVNQDPDLQLVFDLIKAENDGSARLVMTGGLLDPGHKLTGAAWDSQHRVVGLKVTHTITLGKTDRYFLLTTTLTNSGASTLPVRNIADHLSQSDGGGFRPVIPATKTQGGTLLTQWGVDFPGTDAAQPLAASVKAPMVGFMGAEPAGETFDSHTSLGLLPLDVDEFLVAADPQAALSEVRPRYARRVVVGSLPVAGLGAGQSLTHNRRLYLVGGTSQSGALPGMLLGIFNTMAAERATLRGTETGAIQYQSFGTAAAGGQLQTEVRLERNTGGDTWILERVNWREPQENLQSSFFPPYGGLILPVGTYRITTRNRDQSSTFTQLTNINNPDRPDLATPVLVEKDKAFVVEEPLAPERNEVISANGNPIFNKVTEHFFSSQPADGTLPPYQPLRITHTGIGGAPDPYTQRRRGLGGAFDPITKSNAISGLNYGAFLFDGGNGTFATSMKNGNYASAYFVPGSYRSYGTRGPLSRLETLDYKAFDGQANVFHEFIVFQAPLPSNWTTFDLPGPSQATGGGMLPGEQLSSGLAEGISVVARTEMDRHQDADKLRTAFRKEFIDGTGLQISPVPIGQDPLVVNARSSELSGFGQATALFTPAATSDRAGGARPSANWSLADFLTQAEGPFSVIHRPRGPKGLFTLKGFDRSIPLGMGPNAWWTATGALSLGRTHGAFDGLELLRAEGFDAANPTAWFEEFKEVRADWFALLKQQTPASFTKGLGLSSAKFSVDNPVGHARTYLLLGGAVTQEDPSGLLAALKAGSAVASTGPLLEVTANGATPGGTTAPSGGAVALTINLYAPDWVPVDQVRLLVNGAVVQTLDPATFTASGTDFRMRSMTVNLALATAKDAFLVVEAGVPLGTTGAYRPGTPWAKIMRGIYPLAVTNPVFLDLNGGGYTAPGL